MDADAAITLVMEGDPAKREAYLLQKYGAKIGQLLPMDHAVLTPDQLAQSEPVRRFVHQIVASVDPTMGGEYSDWIVRNWLKMPDAQRKRWGEDAYKVHDDLEMFHRYKRLLPVDQRDINKYSFRLLYARQADFKQFAQAEQAKKGENERCSDITTLLSNERWLVLIPKTKEASCKYGRGTRWCTASERYDYFEQYSGSGPLFIIIKKSVPYTNLQTGQTSAPEEEKWQLHLETEQFMDAADDAKDPEAFFLQYPEPGKAIGAWLKSNYSPEKYGEHVGIVDPDSMMELLATGTPSTLKGLLNKVSVPILINGVLAKKLDPARINPLMPHLTAEFTPTTLNVAMNGTDIAECFTKDDQDMARAIYGDGNDVFDHWDFDSNLDFKEALKYPTTHPISKEQLRQIKRIVLDQSPDATEEDWEEYANENDDITSALQRADEDAQRHGAESEAFTAVKSAFEDEFGKSTAGGKVNGVTVDWVVAIPYKKALDLCSMARENGYKTIPVDLRDLGSHAGVEVKIDEPRYGYSGYVRSSFEERLAMELDELDPGEPDLVMAESRVEWRDGTVPGDRTWKEGAVNISTTRLSKHDYEMFDEVVPKVDIERGVYLSALEVKPDQRGGTLGGEALATVIKKYNSVYLFLQAYPFEYAESPATKDTGWPSRSFEVEQQKLIRFYSLFGFEHVGSGWMYRQPNSPLDKATKLFEAQRLVERMLR